MSGKQSIAKWAAGAVAVVLIGTLLWYFSSTVIYILVSAVLAIVGRPLVRLISRLKVGKWSVPRWLSAMITLVVMWVALVGFCLLVVPLVVGKVSSLATLDLGSVLANIQEPLENIQHYLSNLAIMPEQTVSVSEIIVGWLRKVVDYQTINTAFSSVVDITLTLVVAFFSVSFITFFFLKMDFSIKWSPLCFLHDMWTM